MAVVVNLLLISYLLHKGCGGIINWNEKKPKICVNENSYTKLNNGSTEVSVRIHIADLYDINEELMQFGMQIFLAIFWKDYSLNLNETEIPKPEDLPTHVVDCIWLPDIIFLNCKESHLFTTTVPNTVYKIIPGGIVYHYSRYHIMVSCQMDFRDYPMDNQICLLTLQFLTTRDPDAHLTWTEDSKEPTLRPIPNVDIMDDVNPQQFWLEDITADTKNKTYKSGNTTLLVLRIKFNRFLTSSLINTYIPSALVVCLSFVSFWLDVKAVPGRVTLGVTALLTLSTQMVSARSALPSVNYMTALDVWLFGCLVLVFLSLVEFTIANTFDRKPEDNEVTSVPRTSECSKAWGSLHQKENEKTERIFSSRERSIKSVASNQIEQETTTVVDKHFRVVSKKSHDTLDRFSRIFFPICMVVFGIVYWAFYLKRAQRV